MSFLFEFSTDVVVNPEPRPDPSTQSSLILLVSRIDWSNIMQACHAKSKALSRRSVRKMVAYSKSLICQGLRGKTNIFGRKRRKGVILQWDLDESWSTYPWSILFDSDTFILGRVSVVK